MSFRDFTLPKVQQDFELTTDATQSLFTGVAAVPLSETLRRYLDDFQPLGMSMPTEKRTLGTTDRAVVGRSLATLGISNQPLFGRGAER
jgi:hypothetical protein